MTRAAATARPLRSAIRGAAAPTNVTNLDGTALSADRAFFLSLYAQHLRSGTSAAGDLYSPQTIAVYLEALTHLARWADANRRGSTFHDLTTTDLDDYFRHFRSGHTQGGTNTRQRRLRTFYRWLLADVVTEPVANPMDRVQSYAPSAPKPTTQAVTLLDDVLATCTSKTSFEDVRDRAILLLLGTGVRRGELAGLHVEDVNLTDGTITVAALKGTRKHAPVMRHVGGREVRQGRTIPVGSETITALYQWLVLRSRHKLVADANTGPLWYSTRGRGRLESNGIWRMVKRRAEDAGYDPSTVTLHGFRHTRTDQLLANGVADGDVMAVMGWQDREMLDRYAADQRSTRAHAAIRGAGLVR